MEIFSLLSNLTLSFCPISNRHFTNLRKDKNFQKIVEKSNIYVIAQRAEIYFENIVFNKKEDSIDFEIKQALNNSVLNCRIPINQPNLLINSGNIISKFYSNTPNKKSPNIHYIELYKDSVKEENLLIWLSPEKVLHSYWDKSLQIGIIGDFRKFTKYPVHYVGKATEQNVWERLKGHNSLQDILSLECSLSNGYPLSHEIVMLLFHIEDNHHFKFNIFPPPPTQQKKEIITPNQREIYLDSEKALIKAINPKYNTILFKSYPKTGDILNKYNYESIYYSLTDPITLVYKNGTIRGDSKCLKSDKIEVTKEKNINLLKMK